MTIEELHEIRARMKKELYKRDSTGKTIQVSIAMGEKGIAAGAKEIYKEFAKLFDSMNLNDHVILRQTGSMGFEGKEPTVEVVGEDKKHIIYGNVRLENVKTIVDSHIVASSVVSNLVISQ